MFNNPKFQLFTQTLGLLTLIALAVYGALMLFGNARLAFADTAAPSALLGNATDEELAAATAPEAPTASVASAIPPTFNYTGILRNTDGTLVNGTRNVRVVIYDAPVGGSTMYVETFSGVNVRDGQFSVVLGDNPDTGDLLDTFETAPLYVALSTDGGSTYIIPRERVHGVPWAINATNSFDGVPVGGIVDWWRPVNNDSLFPIPDGFLWCAGQQVNDPQSPLDGYYLPNLTNRFALGAVSTADIGLTGGTFFPSHSMNAAGSHRHQWLWFRNNGPGQEKLMASWYSSGTLTGLINHGDGMDTAGSGWYGVMNTEVEDLYTNYDGSHTHSMNYGTHAPPWTAVLKICRIY